MYTVRKRNALVILLVMAILGVLGYMYVCFTRELNVPDSGYVVDIRPGDTSAKTINELASNGVIQWPMLFRAYLKFSGLDRNIKAGEYLISPGFTFKSLLEKIDRGDVILREVTLVEGWTVKQAIHHLCLQPEIICTLNGDPKAVIPLIHTIASRDNPEGMLYPDTYRFSRGTTDAEIVKKANAKLLEVLENAWKARDENTPLRSPYEALILASIVEKETSLTAERRKIAGVFVRRLLQNMRLQTDPTVIYGLGDEYDGNITRDQLQQFSPYNTYKIDGLPPTPIALTGEDSINAVLHPDAGDELYFVARGDGAHEFSSNLEEHNRNVYKYQVKPNTKSVRQGTQK